MLSLTTLCAGAQADGGEPHQELSEQRPCPALRAVSPSVVVAVLVITLPFPERANRAPLPVSWDDACVPGRAQNCMQLHECSIYMSLKKFTDQRSFTPFLVVHCSLLFHKQKWITVDWRVSNRDRHTPDIQVDQPGTAPKVTGPAGLHFRLLC